MKQLIFAFIASMSVVMVGAQTNAKPFVVPEVTEWQGGEGTTPVSHRIVVKNNKLNSVADALASDYTKLTSAQMAVAKGKAASGDIVLSLVKDKALGNEGYRIKIGQTVNVEAATTQGAYWATRTLLQLMEQSTKASEELPRGIITDVPQYRLRGFMLDVGRKYIPMSYLRNLVQVMSYYKMNALQIHLNDNGFKKFFDNDWDKTQAAFRLECETYPGLTAKDGHYTKAEFRELQQLATQYGVEIIPEIDAPAHALAFTHYRPELGSKEYGMDHFNLANPDVYPFMDALFAEYLGGKNPVFSCRRVNIGTDEYSNANQEVIEQFRTYTDHYLALVEKYGKQPMLWGALTHAIGTTPVRSKNVIMHCWYNGFAAPDSMKTLGYQLVSIPDRDVYIVPAAGYYFDYLNTENLYNNWTPAKIGNQRFEEQDPQIEGGMFAVWNDHAGNGISTKDIHHRLFPALQTISTKCWTGQLTSLPYSDYDKSRKLLSEAPGVNELGTLPSQPIHKDKITKDSNLELPVVEAGYNYRVSFDIDCAKEQQGTILFASDNAVFYLSAPGTGRLGFARDKYLNTFNYTLPESGKVNIRIEGNNRETRLYVNGYHRQTLGIEDVYVFSESTRVTNEQNVPHSLKVYRASDRMKYVQTLVFPLQRTGSFNSTVSNLHVEAM